MNFHIALVLDVQSSWVGAAVTYHTNDLAVTSLNISFFFNPGLWYYL
jgi:hypothetical protein